MPTTSLAGNVQESKAQRQERLKSRFRDRGGIFVPSEGNPLVDILLSRGVNGESPFKKRPPRKSIRTPNPRSSASRTKTPRTGASKRAPSKSTRVGDENYPPPSMKKPRGTARTPKLQVSERTNGMDAGTSAGLSPPHAAAQRKSFADQLADAIKSAETRTVPDSLAPSRKVKPAGPSTLPGTPPQQGKDETALGKCKAKPVAVLTPRYFDEPNQSGDEHVYKSIKCPALVLLEKQGGEKQGGRMKRQESAAPEIEQVIGAGVKTMRPPLLHDQGGSSSDSSLPLAKKHAAAKSKRARPLAGTRKKPKLSKEEASPLPRKRGRPKGKALPRPAEDPSDKAMLQEKEIAPAPAPVKVPRKRKERVKASVNKDDNNNDDEHEHEGTHGLPQKKRRRADLTASRNAKENKEMSRSAREVAANMDMDKPLPSPVKKPARESPKPPSKAKAKAKTSKPRSRTGASAKSGTRPRGLPLDVRRRVEVIARDLPATDFDDDDPIDFLR